MRVKWQPNTRRSGQGWPNENNLAMPAKVGRLNVPVPPSVCAAIDAGKPQGHVCAIFRKMGFVPDECHIFATWLNDSTFTAMRNVLQEGLCKLCRKLRH